MACDLPFLDAGLLARLVELSDGHDGAWVRTVRGTEPLLAVYARTARHAVRSAIEAGRLQAGALDAVLAMAAMTADELTQFGRPERLLANVNSPDDFARVQLPAS